MKKYFHIFKTTLIDEFQYIPNLLFGFISFLFLIFIFLNLWQYIYQDETSLINGYSIAQMLWYVTVTEMLWYGTRNSSLTSEISNDIKSGKIAYNINKPYNYALYIMSKYIAQITIKIFLNIGFALIVGYLLIGGLSTFQISSIPYLIIIFILAILISAIIKITISLTSFWLEESKPVHWIYDKLILVVGTIFPLEMFPSVVQPFIKLSPVFVITYGPAKLVVDFSMDMFYTVFTTQIIYLIMSIGLIIFMYSKGVKKLNVNGG